MQTVLNMPEMTTEDLDAYYSYEQGVADRESGRPPRFSDNYYFRGYSDTIAKEIAFDLAHTH